MSIVKIYNEAEELFRMKRYSEARLLYNKILESKCGGTLRDLALGRLDTIDCHANDVIVNNNANTEFPESVMIVLRILMWLAGATMVVTGLVFTFTGVLHYAAPLCILGSLLCKKAIDI